MQNYHKHKSGLETWEAPSGPNGTISIMKCPHCKCENEWPYDIDDETAECYGGCGRWFKYDNAKDDAVNEVNPVNPLVETKKEK